MMKPVIIGIAALLLAGCMQAAAPTGPSGPTSDSADGMARKLKPGSSENDAFLTFGPESGFERNPENWDQSCLSYAYGPAEAPKYVHARYEMGTLVQATDGHRGICTYAAPTAPAT